MTIATNLRMMINSLPWYYRWIIFPIKRRCLRAAIRRHFSDTKWLSNVEIDEERPSYLVLQRLPNSEPPIFTIRYETSNSLDYIQRKYKNPPAKSFGFWKWLSIDSYLPSLEVVDIVPCPKWWNPQKAPSLDWIKYTFPNMVPVLQNA